MVLGVPEDLPRAIELFERAADAEEYFAVLHVARLYADGRLGYSDSERARFWYERLLELASEDQRDQFSRERSPMCNGVVKRHRHIR